MKVVSLICTFLIAFFMVFNVNAYDKSIVDVTKTTITEINYYIDKGYLTYEELIRLYLDRIDAYEDNYNALISVNENALEEAKKCDEIYKQDGRKSPIFCIPIVLKDNIDYVDLPTTGGTLALKNSYPNKNAEITQNLIDNGAIILAKTNMSELAFSATDSFSSYGHVRNAYNILYTPYGSSGGSAVAVAVSFAPISIGTDTNSSIRLPASANNVIGLRPTQGLLSNDGIISYDPTRDTAGPISKTVEDNAILLTILANNGIDYTKSLKKDGLKDKNIGVLTQFITSDEASYLKVLNKSYDEIENLMKSVIKKMEEAGANIIYIDDFYDEQMDEYYDVTESSSLLCNEFNKYIKNTSSKIKNFSELIDTDRYIQNLSDYSEYCNSEMLNDKYYKEIAKTRKEYQEVVKSKMKKYNVDVLIYPTTKNKLPKIGEINYFTVASVSYTIAPTTGFPSISMPMGFDSDNLPYGFEILTYPNQEELLYEIAYSYEQLDNKIVIPEISPSLYEVPNVLSLLKELYENNKVYSKSEEFIDIRNKVRDILFNYNDYDGTDKEIEEVYNSYKEAIEKVKINNKKRKQMIRNANIILSILIILDLAIIIKKIIKFKKS